MLPFVSEQWRFASDAAYAQQAGAGMVAIANNAASAAPAVPLQAIAGTIANRAASNPSPSPTNTPADSVEISDQAKAVLGQITADQTAIAAIPTSLDEIVTKQTDDLADSLSKAFAADNIPLDQAIRLQVDKFGNVQTEGPWKKKIDEVLKDNPELAKKLKTVAGLNALKAAQEALDLYNQQKKSANPKQQAEAWTQYNIQSMNIQTLSGVMTLKDGKLRSAAVDYIDTIADPTGANAAKSQSDPVKAQKDIADRLA
jgi:hypothetical protein